ncbi:RNA polymerase sigma factor [Candidatus Izemoplasma sp. B36]|uniref:RNA polymerase sigma factor n=1 Tax=Candidatus Izemoplasma sp. B36 TaxID=3242468 RepID=UPI003557FCC4
MVNYEDYIDNLIKKDNEAFKVIYENTKKGVFSMIISIVNNKAATEDLMQDTYMKMIQKIHQYKRGRNFYAWLIQIAKNTALDYVRKEKRNLVFDPQENSQIFEKPTNDRNDFIVYDYVKDLDHEERQVVLLRIISDLKFKDIAKSLNKPVGTVLWLYNRAIKKLQKQNREE